MDKAQETSDEEEEEEDWMAINWDGNLSSRIKLLNKKKDEDYPDKPEGSTEGKQKDEGMAGDDKSSNEPMVSRMLLNDNKAGMSGVDKERINQIIFEASKGSKYFENERKKEEQVTKRIEEQKQKQKTITQEHLDTAEKEADLLLEEFDRLRDLSRTIVHVDMDAFYAAVEMRDNPALRDKPMAVGGNSMLSTSNYHARKFGVRAAMPGFIGKKLCPELVIVPLHFDKYNAVSKEVRDILGTFDPNYCPVSLDEAYLDFTDHITKRSSLSEKERTVICRTCDSFDKSHCLCDLNETLGLSCSEIGTVNVKGSPSDICGICGKPVPGFELVTFKISLEEAVKEMRCRIQQKTCLTASAGIAPNMMLAKVCSDMKKPNGQYIIPSTVEDVMSFIRKLPIRKISGIGKVSERMLNAVEVKTCQDLYNKRGLLYHLYSQISFNYFMRICLGIGSTTVERDGERKSMSTERTFPEMSAPAELYSKCLELCHSLAEDLQSEALKGKTVTIKIKTVKFDVKTRACSLPDYTNDAEVIYIAAKDLLCKEMKNVHPQPLQLRLMGVRMSTLVDQTLLSNKRQQNTLIQFVKKGEKIAKNESQHGECSNQESEKQNVVNELVQCYVKTTGNLSTKQLEQNPDSMSQFQLSHCDNNTEQGPKDNIITLEKDMKQCDNVQDLVSMRNPDSAEINSEKSCMKMPTNKSEEQQLSDEGTNDINSTEEKCNTVWYTCPVCRDEVGCSDLHSFNHHIDTCLSKSVVKECSRYTPEEESPKSKKTPSRKTITPKRKSSTSTPKLIKSKFKTPPKLGNIKYKDPVTTLTQESAVIALPSSEGPSTSETQETSNTESSVEKITKPQGCDVTETLVCPVCFMEQTGTDLDAFNQHVDSCLCKGTITEILREQKHGNKRSLGKQGSKGAGGKRKRQDSGTKCQSIATFFQMNT